MRWLQRALMAVNCKMLYHSLPPSLRAPDSSLEFDSEKLSQAENSHGNLIIDENSFECNREVLHITHASLVARLRHTQWSEKLVDSVRFEQKKAELLMAENYLEKPFERIIQNQYY